MSTKIVAALFSLALITTGVAIAQDKGNGNSPPGNVLQRDTWDGRITDGIVGSSVMTEGNVLTVTMSNGQTQSFTIGPSAQTAMRTHAGKPVILFSSNGKTVTDVASPGETATMRVIAANGNTYTLQSSDGQQRVIAASRSNHHKALHVGSQVRITTISAVRSKVVVL